MTSFPDFGMPAMNNPFLPMTSVAHSTPNIDQSKVAAVSRTREALVCVLQLGARVSQAKFDKNPP